MCIFAKQLQQVLGQHHKTFGQLYNVSVEDGGYDGRRISAGQIKRLQQAASGNRSISATLSGFELEAVQQAFSFTPEEVRRLRAALAAESILRFLLERIEQVKAIQIGETLFHLLFDADDSEFIALRSRMIDDIRANNINLEQDTAEQNRQKDIEQAIEAYEHALLWLDTARMTQNSILRQGYLAMISSLLTSAYELLDYPRDEAPQLTEWRQIIKQAMTDMYNIEAI